MASYPYDDSPSEKWTFFANYTATPDDDIFKQLAKTYAENHPIMSTGEGCCGFHFDNGITNGAFWYVCKCTCL